MTRKAQLHSSEPIILFHFSRCTDNHFISSKTKEKHSKAKVNKAHVKFAYQGLAYFSGHGWW
jgi:hypothetical protein